MAWDICDCCVRVDAEGRRSCDLLSSRLALFTTEATADAPASSVFDLWW